MRPIRDIDEAFFEPDPSLDCRMPILEEWVARQAGARPLENVSVLLIQHQLSNQMPMLRALFALGLTPERVHWLDIPYTSHELIQAHVSGVLGVPKRNLSRHDYKLLAPYAPYQLGRTVEALLARASANDDALLVLDDGAYAIEALAGLARSRWPRRVSIVEQTTRGLIKLERSAMLRSVARTLPVVNVARSAPKRLLEPPFIAMAICSALRPKLHSHFGAALGGRCLVLGYGAIGEQVASYVRALFRLDQRQVHVHDSDEARAALARRRGFPPWDRGDLETRFRLVIGCSGVASFGLGDSAWLEDGALLVSASSGAVELSRQEFIEQADASDLDDISVEKDGLNQGDIHADLSFRLVDRRVTFANAGFPVNFDGRLAVIPTELIQPTATMMVAAAVQAANATTSGLLELESSFCDWLERRFRAELGPRASWLEPQPEVAW